MLPHWIERTLKQGLIVYRDLDINEDIWHNWIAILERRGWGLEFSSNGNRFWAPGYGNRFGPLTQKHQVRFTRFRTEGE